MLTYGLQIATKPTGRTTKDTKASKIDDTAYDARVAARDAVTEKVEIVQKAMLCKDCNRPCYKSWDNKCCIYTHEYMTEHGKLLVSSLSTSTLYQAYLLVCQAKGEPGVVPNKVPDVMKSKLLDYVRPGRKSDRTGQADEEQARNAIVTDEVHGNPQNAMVRATEVRAYVGPLDFPLISMWLKKCEEGFERGCDKHEYSKLTPVFDANGCTRIDDIARMSSALIRELALEAGISITIGLANRVHEYATDDVMYVKKFGRLD